jgi:DNA-binding transcriptional LysR family regulator
MISQSTLARRIASLEGMLNRELLVRAPRGVGLTPDGDALLPTAHRILQAVRDAQENP